MARSEKRTGLKPAGPPCNDDCQIASEGDADPDAVADTDNSDSQDRDDMIEHWLRNDVATAYDAIEADPSRGILIETAFERLRARHGAPSIRRA